MFTPFAVATPKQARYLRSVHDLGDVNVVKADYPYIDRGWVEFRRSSRGVQLTPAGHVALELREILGPDRNLTKAQGGVIWKYGATPGVVRKLVALGLMDKDSSLTEDGEKIKYVLIKYGVSV